MKKIKVSFIAAGLLVATGVFFAACKKSSFENLNPETSNIMAFNLVPGKAVSVIMSGNLLGYSPLPFNSYTGSYLSIYPGNRIVESFDHATGDSLSVKESQFEAGKYYSVFVLGSGTEYQNVVVQDKVDTLSGSNGKAYIRYINAVNGSVSPNVSVTSSGGSIINDNPGFAELSDFIEVAPGEITVSMTEGTSTNVSRSFSVEGRKVYTILLTSGNTTTDPAQIKYVVHGVLDENDGTSRGQATNFK